MVKELFTNTINKLLSSLSLQPHVVCRHEEREETFIERRSIMTETTISTDLVRQVQAILKVEIEACNIWIDDNPKEDHKGIALRIKFMCDTFVELSARLGIFEYPDLIRNSTLRANAIINDREV